MSARILDGRTTRAALIPGLLQKIQALSYKPNLVIIQVGERADSTAFIQAKKTFARQISVKENHIQLPEITSQSDLLTVIQDCNQDQTIDGIIVQLPLPSHIDAQVIIESIDPHKDVDGLTSKNIQSLKEGKSAIMAATARGIRELLIFNDIQLKGKKVTVVGRSQLVGTPIAEMCRSEGADVTVCHSKTVDLALETKGADVLIVAVGKPGLIGVRHVKEGQIVVDVGITRNGEEKLVGDVDFESVKDIVGAITPVPGGVGPMTVFALFENLIDLCAANR